jgi:hypothetical protein
MTKMLKPLLLPKLVEERRKRESMQETEMDLSSSTSSAYNTQNSSASDLSSPATPTFSMRGHMRYSSSASSVDASPFITAIETPASPTFSQRKSGKRSLPDVQEEPQEKDDRDERNADFEMFDDVDELYDCFCTSKDPRV